MVKSAPVRDLQQVCDRNSWYMVVELSDKKNRHFVIVSQYHAILCNTIQYQVTPCNTMQYHAILCNTMQYHASLITADGAYHCPVGSIMAIFFLDSHVTAASNACFWVLVPTLVNLVAIAFFSPWPYVCHGSWISTCLKQDCSKKQLAITFFLFWWMEFHPLVHGFPSIKTAKSCFVLKLA